MAAVEMDTSSIRDLEVAAKAVRGVTKKQLTPAVRKAMKPILQAAKDAAPVDTGSLKKGIVLRSERNKPPLKKVFEVTFDAKMSDVFVKITKPGHRYYYPASQEYGFKKLKGGKQEGKHFLKKAAEQEEAALPDSIEKELLGQIQKEWTKQHG